MVDLNKKVPASSGAMSCEEANMSGMLNPFTKEVLPCGKTAVASMFSEKDGRTYRMCEMCADHNGRRGMIEVVEEKSVGKTLYQMAVDEVRGLLKENPFEAERIAKMYERNIGVCWKKLMGRK